MPHVLCHWAPLLVSLGGIWASLLASLGEIRPHHWCCWEGLCPFIDFTGGNYAPLLESVDEKVPQGLNESKQRATSGTWAAIWRPLV